MFLRLQYFSCLPANLEAIKKLYRDEINPAISEFRGFLNLLLLEPTDKAENLIAISEWMTPDDAAAYDNSGVYKEMRAKLTALATKDPVLKTYQVDVMSRDISKLVGVVTESWPDF